MAVSLLLFLSLSATAKTEPVPVCQSPWLPLDVGNYWVYRVDSRNFTGRYVTLRVLGPYEFEGKIYCQVESPGANHLIRVDAEGRIFRRYFDSPADEMILDPMGKAEFPLESPLGFATQAITTFSTDIFYRRTTTYARAVGVTVTHSYLQSGSSGGFISSETLIEASVNGKIYRAPANTRPSVQLELGREFRNCAVPCYYVACGIGSPVDPPNTNKPCLEARLETASLDPGSSLLVTISDSDGKSRYAKQIQIEPNLPVLFASLPFYNQQFTGSPVTLFPAAEYLVSLTALSPEGTIVATTTQRATYP